MNTAYESTGRLLRMPARTDPRFHQVQLQKEHATTCYVLRYMSRIPSQVRVEILRRLRDVEQSRGVRVLLAVESGSRAWGFESRDSDYDVRFVYVHTLEHYLSIDLGDQRDVIERPIADEIDLSGWELRKALRLFLKSNPGFVEWIQSPIVYIENGSFATRVRELVPVVYSRASGIHHYKSMAMTNVDDRDPSGEVSLKKYLYILRALLAARWLQQHEGAAPIEFGRLLRQLEGPPQLLADIDGLLVRKRAATERDRTSAVASIDAFIEQQLLSLQTVGLPGPVGAAVKLKLDEVFRGSLREAWLETSSE
jgi:uncharacterized protein